VAGAAIGFQALAQGQTDPVVARIIELGTRDNQVMTWNDFASNRFGGRETGTNAYTDATQWAVWQFKQFGLDAQLEEVGEVPVGFNRGPWFGKMLEPTEKALRFGTPEQEIPSTGIPGVSWETCMTMNDHWGYNKADQNWKSSTDLVRKLADIASKGGNFLLNVGPTSEGLFPDSSIDRLREMGRWMSINGESIYGTSASPFKSLEWGRCTQKTVAGGIRLYLHVFKWPSDGKLLVPGILNDAKGAYLLSDPRKLSQTVTRHDDALVVNVPSEAPDPLNSVVVLDVIGKIDVTSPPLISGEFSIFIDSLIVTISSERENVEVRYTTDRSFPSINSRLVTGPISLTETTVLTARCFRAGKAVSGAMAASFSKVRPRSATVVDGLEKGIRYSYFEGDWDTLPDFGSLRPAATGVLPHFDFTPRKQVEHFGFLYEGYIRIETDGVYTFFTESDDGSRLYVGDTLVVDNDMLHPMTERGGVIALARGVHPIRVEFFEKTGGDGLVVSFKGPGTKKQIIPPVVVFHKR